jgi:hypothetical protein
VLRQWPQAVMMAYNAAINRDDGNDSGLMVKSEFEPFLKSLTYYTGLWNNFRTMDKNYDDRLSLGEFVKGCSICGLGLAPVSAAREFNRMDTDGSGAIYFEEYVHWAVKFVIAKEPPPATVTKNGTPAPTDHSVDLWLQKMQERKREAVQRGQFLARR